MYIECTRTGIKRNNGGCEGAKSCLQACQVYSNLLNFSALCSGLTALCAGTSRTLPFIQIMLLSLNPYWIVHSMCTSWCVNGQAHHCLADNDRLIFFLSLQGASVIEQGSEDQLAKVRKFWQSLSTGQRSEILSTSLDDNWAKVLDVTDDGEYLHSLHQASTTFLSCAQQKALSTGAKCVHAFCLPKFARWSVSFYMACSAD